MSPEVIKESIVFGESIGDTVFSNSKKRKVRIMTKFKGFTLAEVLITLGIIGVVAAMTMPTLINSTQGAQYKTAYKKALSSQTADGTQQGQDADGEAQTLYTLFKNRMNVVKVADGGDFTGDAGDANAYIIVDGGSADDLLDTEAPADDGTGGHGGDATLWTGLAGQTQVKMSTLTNSTLLFFNDGTTFIFDNTKGGCAASTATTDDNYCYGWIDVNGQKGPNRVVRCDGDNVTAGASGSNDDSTCTVTNPTDIYPVAFFDQSIIPGSAAARAVLYAK